MDSDVLAAPAPEPHIIEAWPRVLSPRLGAFMDYLDRCRLPGGSAARLSAFDLLAIPDLISRLVLIDPIKDNSGGVRFRFRFVGTWHLTAFGHDITGRFADELRRDPMVDLIQKALETVLDAGEPHYWLRTSLFERQQFITYQRIMAPLADDDGRVVRIVGCYDTVDA